MRITIQTATRNRSHILADYVDNVFSMAAEPDNVEMLFWVDDDDMESLGTLNKLPVKTIIGPQGKGYADHPRFHTEMAKIALGNLLMQANDDMLFVTQGWDRLLHEAASQNKDNIFVLKMKNEVHPERMPFPVIHRRIVEIMGCFTPLEIPWIDRFLWTVFHELNRFIPVNSVKTKHQRLGGTSYEGCYFNGNQRNLIQRKKVEYWVTILKEHMDV